MNAWYVYILQCEDGTLYTGVTTHLERRVRQHNGEIKGGAKYTSTRRPVVMVWSESQIGRSEACKREYAIKQLSRKEKLKLFISE